MLQMSLDDKPVIYDASGIQFHLEGRGMVKGKHAFELEETFGGWHTYLVISDDWEVVQKMRSERPLNGLLSVPNIEAQKSYKCLARFVAESL